MEVHEKNQYLHQHQINFYLIFSHNFMPYSRKLAQILSWQGHAGIGHQYATGKTIRQIITFQSFLKLMEEGLKLECNLNLAEDQMQGGRKIGCWSIHENLLYSIFVDRNKMIMISKKKRKRTRIFDQMSHFITSRNSLQCRSHHQKLIQKLGDIKQIIIAFKKYFGKQYYRQQYNLHTGKKSREARPNTSHIKNQDITLLQYCPSSQHESESGEHLEPVNEQSPSNGKDNEPEKGVGNNETLIVPCKTQQSIQYYTPYSYYIGNTLIPFTFFNGFYPLQQIQ